jgi:hypothetical protein
LIRSAGTSRARLLAPLAILAVALTMLASSASAERIRMQALIQPDGSGSLFVNTQGGPWAWDACSAAEPSGRCLSFGQGREITTTGAVPGTIFRVRGQGAAKLSPEWRGRLKQLEAPGVQGAIRANEFVSPTRALWSGGWGNEYSIAQLAACSSPSGGSCVAISDLSYLRPCLPSASLVLDQRFSGTYLRLAERRIGPGPPSGPANAVSVPSEAVWERDRATSVRFLGQIAPALRSYSGECGPAPEPEASISNKAVATVVCQAGCRAVLIARDERGRTARVVRRISEQNALVLAPPIELQPPAWITRQGKVRVVVTVDGKTTARRNF